MAEKLRADPEAVLAIAWDHVEAYRARPNTA